MTRSSAWLAAARGYDASHEYADVRRFVSTAIVLVVRVTGHAQQTRRPRRPGSAAKAAAAAASAARRRRRTIRRASRRSSTASRSPDGTAIPTFWRAENGAIVGESTPEKRVAENSFLIWRGGTVADFELKIDFRINGTNSGVQYRSKERPDVGKWVLQGYQADMDFGNQFTGNVHDERGPRFFLARRGNVVRGVDGGGKKQVGALETADALKAYVKVNDWNQLHVVARGWTLMHFINGHLMAVFIDEDATNRMAEGLLGLQMHVGDPFKVEYRNIWLKKLAKSERGRVYRLAYRGHDYRPRRAATETGASRPLGIRTDA